MSESTQPLPGANTAISANDAVFSVETRDAAMHVISISEARKEFGRSGMTSQGLGAFFRSSLGSIGIDLGGSPVEHAARLVALRAMTAAANDARHETKKLI